MKMFLLRFKLSGLLAVSGFLTMPLPAEPAKTDPRSNPAPTATKGDEPQTAGLKKKQSLIKGLLLREVSAQEFAGKASQMNCTAVAANNPSAISLVSFNQEVGSMMTSALSEVLKHLEITRGRFPDGYRVEISFEDKFTPKDGPSAAVACALMLDSLVSGNEMDQSFAVTGDMNADGSVQPVGGVADKIRAASNRDCTHVGVPAANEPSVSDLVVVSGLKPIMDIQVFSISNFAEALDVGSSKKSAKVERAMENFAEVQHLLNTRKDITLLANAKVQEKLRTVLADAPNHLSAKYLLRQGLGKPPKILSLRGSLDAIDRAGGKLMSNLKAPKPEGIEPDVLAIGLGELAKLREKVDHRTVPFCDSIIAFGKELKTWKNSPPKSESEREKLNTRIRTTGQKVDAEYEKLRADKKLAEELMK